MAYYRILFLVFVISSCSISKDENVELNSSCIEMKQNQTFSTIRFKEGYSIQFPLKYTGKGMKIEEWASFEMVSENGNKFHYSYLCENDCVLFFGKELESPPPEELLIQNSLELNNRIDFCTNSQLNIFYYSSDEKAKGVLFLNNDSKLKEALSIEFNVSNLEEVSSIIRTIKKI